ncbi:MAG: ankyrin repeat domain-containing protein [Cyclobacteriaceae bacterium]
MDEFGRTDFHYAIIDQELETVVRLLNSGVDVNQQDNHGWTALHFACQNYDIEICQLLIDRKASIDIKDSDGSTPLFRATFECRDESGELIKLLIKNGANPHEPNNYGNSPFSLAEKVANYDLTPHFR